MNKKIMILGAGTYQVPLIKKAKERGLLTVVVSPKGEYPGFEYADRKYYYDVRDEKNILEAAKSEKIDGIITDQTDMAIRTVAYVAQNMGLPGIDYEAARIFTDKYLMREKSRQLGLPTIQYKIVDNIDSAVAFFNKIDGDAIIKPVDNQGSRGIGKIESIKDLYNKYAEASSYAKDGRVIIEQFIEGQEFEVDSIAVDGEVKTLMYADVNLFNIPDVFSSYSRIYPSEADQTVVDRLLKLDLDIVSGFGLTEGLSHSEYVMSKDGTIYLIEAAARGGGAYVSSHITTLQTGIDTANFLIDLALGEINKMPDFNRNLCYCAGVSFYLPMGEVVSLDGIDKVRDMTFVYKHALDRIYIGMKTEAISDKTARFVNVITGETKEDRNANIERFRNALDIRVKTSTGEIKGPIWK